MQIFSQIRRFLGKSFVGLGQLGLVALAIAVPLAFTVQLGTPGELLLLAAIATIASAVLIKAGDLIADYGTLRASDQIVTTIAASRPARDRRTLTPRMSDAAMRGAGRTADRQTA